MVVRVKTSFCGAVTASRGQVIELTEEQAKDLIQAGYVAPVAEAKPEEEPKDTPGTAPASPDTVAVETAENPEAEEPKDPKPKRARKK